MFSPLHLEAFPDARTVTTAAVIPDAETQLSPELMSFWNAIFPGQIAEHAACAGSTALSAVP